MEILIALTICLVFALILFRLPKEKETSLRESFVRDYKDHLDNGMNKQTVDNEREQFRQRVERAAENLRQNSAYGMYGQSRPLNRTVATLNDYEERMEIKKQIERLGILGKDGYLISVDEYIAKTKYTRK